MVAVSSIDAHRCVVSIAYIPLTAEDTERTQTISETRTQCSGGMRYEGRALPRHVAPRFFTRRNPAPSSVAHFIHVTPGYLIYLALPVTSVTGSM